jgi:hypothetical protein
MSIRLLKSLFAGLFLLSAGLGFSSTLSVMVVETGIGGDTPRLDVSSLWEGGLMDVFFDTGHIVSNAPILRLERDAIGVYPEERLLDLEEAILGGAEYYILVVLDYGPGEDGEDVQSFRPRSIALRFVRINPRRVLYETQLRGNPRSTLGEELATAKSAAREIISHFEG